VVLGLAGYKGSGKDTLAALLASYGFRRVAFADPLKLACRAIFGFTAAQVEDPAQKEVVDPRWGFTPRWAMQRLGTEGVRGSVADDVWVKSFLLRAAEEPSHVVVTDVRFRNEVDAVRSLGGRVFLVQRAGCTGDGHASEALASKPELFDGVVRNDGAPRDMLSSPALFDFLSDFVELLDPKVIGSTPFPAETQPDDQRCRHCGHLRPARVGKHCCPADLKERLGLRPASPALADLSAARERRAALKDAVWLATAREVSRLGTCRRLKVGCVLLREDGSVAGVGYNGALPGAPHCEPGSCNASARCLRTRHAERSALDYSLGAVSTAYVTDEPCLRCAMDLIARGVRRVVFGRRYQPEPREAEARAAAVEWARVCWEHLEVDQ
jgi:dCMP deaminase